MRYPKVSDRDEKGFAPPLTPGNYFITLADVKEHDRDGNRLKFPRDGQEYSRFEFTVKGYPNILFDKFVFNENWEHANISLGRFKQFLMAIEVDPDKEGDTQELIGKSCMAAVTTKVYRDKTYNNILEYQKGSEDTNDDDDNLPF